MLLIFTLPNLSQLDQGVKISYDILTHTHPSLLLINDKVLFAFHIYLRRCIINYYIHINDSMSIHDAYILHYQHMISQSYKWFYQL